MTRSAALDLVPPTFEWMPEYGRTLGDEVSDLADLAGFTPDPEQRLALDMLFALDARGKAAVRDLAVVAPRQNLKTGFLKQAALGWLFITEQRLVVWSAHEFSTSQESFRDMAQLIESCPDLDREVKQVHYGNGEESIELVGDRRLKFKARTKSGGRGLTGDKIVLDEAMYLRPSHMGALVPTLRAVPDPQLVLAGSAGMVDSDVWRSYRDRGRRGGDPSLGFLEFCDPDAWSCEPCAHLPGTPGCALDERARWWRCNTALGRRITEQTLASDRLSLPPREFARETHGWWEDPPNPDGGAIDLTVWGDLAAPGTAMGAEPVFGVDVDADRLANVAVVWPKDGVTFAELACEPMPAHELPARVRGIAGDRPVAAPSAVKDELERAGCRVVEVKATVWAQASSAVLDAVAGNSLRHGNQTLLNEAARVVRLGRPSSSGARPFVLQESSGAGPIFALTRALHGLTAAADRPGTFVSF